MKIYGLLKQLAYVKCKNCQGKIRFSRRKKSKIFCNRTCYTEYYYKINNKRVISRVDCFWCGDTFLQKRTDQKFCSKKCSDYNSAENKRQKIEDLKKEVQELRKQVQK